jgi:hypothetical protein
MNGPRKTRALVEKLFASAHSIEAIAALRAELRTSIESGEINPPVKALRAWNEATWIRVLELMVLDPRKAAHVHAVTLPWIPNGDTRLRAALDHQLAECTKLLTA